MHLLTFLLKEQSGVGTQYLVGPISTLLQNFPTSFPGPLPWLGGEAQSLGRHADVTKAYPGGAPYKIDWGAYPRGLKIGFGAS